MRSKTSKRRKSPRKPAKRASTTEKLGALIDAKRALVGVIGMGYVGLPLALATDCNPGSCYTESMPFVFGLAVLNMHLSVNEALVAGTLNAAYALDMAKEVGSLDAGKSADFLLLDGDSPAILAYHAGVSPVVEVYKRGELVFSV